MFCIQSVDGNTTKNNFLKNGTFSCAKELSVSDCSEVRGHSEAGAAGRCKHSELVDQFHNSDGCALAEDKGSDYNGDDAPNC